MAADPNTTPAEPGWWPMSVAPKTDSPLWVRGFNFGTPTRGRHYCWAYWNGHVWMEAGAGDEGTLQFLTEWKLQ